MQVVEFIAEHASQLVVWALALIGALIARYGIGWIKNAWARDVVNRAYGELADAVLEVWETYVKELKESRADGKLTDDERAEAKRRALAIAKANLGEKGLQRLAKALGLRVDGNPIAEPGTVGGWLSSKTETAVAGLKAVGVIPSGSNAEAVPDPI